MKIYLYSKNNSIYSFESGKIKEIKFDNLGDFVKKNRDSLFYLIFSKLDIFYRKLEFEFKDRKKAKLILRQELEGKFPKSLDNFYFYFYFYYIENKTIVNVFAVEKEKLDFFKRIFEENRVKLNFTIDSILIHQYFREKLKEKDGIEIFVEDDYLLLNLIENYEISAIYSYSSKNIFENLSEILNSLLSIKKFSAYYFGERKIYDEMKRDEIKFLSEGNFFDLLKEIKKINPVYFKGLDYLAQRQFQIDYIFYLLFLLIASLFLTRPYFLKNKRDKEVEKINQKMVEIYRSLFPETENVVNPLIQIKEKLGYNEKESLNKLPISDISVIKILEEVTLLFPENANGGVEELIYSGKTVNLTGICDNLKVLDRIKENAKKSKIFKICEVNSISFTKENNVRFNLFLKMEE